MFSSYNVSDLYLWAKAECTLSHNSTKREKLLPISFEGRIKNGDTVLKNGSGITATEPLISIKTVTEMWLKCN